MFDPEGASHLIEAETSSDTGNVLEEIIWRSQLPGVVRSAPLAYSATRIMDDAEIARITDDRLNIANCKDMTDRLRRRRKALLRVRGKDITCAVVRMPGAVYTLEIDTAAQKLVHWEWQAT